MQRDPRAYLWDAREAAQAILAFTADMDAKAYVTNELVQAAVERKFEVIGEALNQLSKWDAAKAARIQDLPQVVAFRNQLGPVNAISTPALSPGGDGCKTSVRGKACCLASHRQRRSGPAWGQPFGPGVWAAHCHVAVRLWWKPPRRGLRLALPPPRPLARVQK